MHAILKAIIHGKQWYKELVDVFLPRLRQDDIGDERPLAEIRTANNKYKRMFYVLLMLFIYNPPVRYRKTDRRMYYLMHQGLSTLETCYFPWCEQSLVMRRLWELMEEFNSHHQRFCDPVEVDRAHGIL